MESGMRNCTLFSSVPQNHSFGNYAITCPTQKKRWCTVHFTKQSINYASVGL